MPTLFELYRLGLKDAKLLLLKGSLLLVLSHLKGLYSPRFASKSESKWEWSHGQYYNGCTAC